MSSSIYAPPLPQIPRSTLGMTETDSWLATLLACNANTEFLRCHGSPRTLEAFRDRVPVVDYDDLRPWLDRICMGEPDVLFAGRPIAFERTGGSRGAAKLIPYSAEGLRDFQRSVTPWLAGVVKRHGITGRMYFSISPATRSPESIGDVPVGLPDGAYLGEAAASLLARMTAVPFEVASITNVAHWRDETLRHLRAARDLELISVWSPTFLLRLLDYIEDPRSIWPRLKVVSCWAAGSSRPFANELAARLPHAHLQPKGLLSTETVVTVPDADDQPALIPFGFFEFERGGQLFLPDELREGDVYEVVATTASGLYRYRTADLVRYDGLGLSGRPILEFVGRGRLVSDLVGEKLTEPFVAECLEHVPGFRLLVPDSRSKIGIRPPPLATVHRQPCTVHRAPSLNGYVLVTEAGALVDLADVERRLCANPQYAYARRLGQLEALRHVPIPRLFDRYAQAHVEHGVRLGDVKPAALRNERDWLVRLGES
jgi:hypothetical protein